MLESRKECTRSSMKNRLWREVGSRGTKVEFCRVIQGRWRGPDIGWQWGRSEVTDLSDPLSFQVSFVIKVQFLNVCVWWGGGGMCTWPSTHTRAHACAWKSCSLDLEIFAIAPQTAWHPGASWSPECKKTQLLPGLSHSTISLLWFLENNLL